MKTQLQDACLINEELSSSTMAFHLEIMLKTKVNLTFSLLMMYRITSEFYPTF